MGFFSKSAKRSAQNAQELNQVFSNPALGNLVLRLPPKGTQGSGQGDYGAYLYPSLAGVTQSGIVVSIDTLTRNANIATCLLTICRAVAQCPTYVGYKEKDGSIKYATRCEEIGERDSIRARAVEALLVCPNQFQSQYEFLFQLINWLEITGEGFVLLYRPLQDASDPTLGGNPNVVPSELYVLDSSLITTTINEFRYPSYRLSSPAYGYSKDATLPYYSVIHYSDFPWQGQSGWTKGTLAAELVSIDHNLDVYSNWVLRNAPKASAILSSTEIIQDTRYVELKKRLKNSFANLLGRQTDESQVGEIMMLDGGLSLQQLEMMKLTDADIYNLKQQTTRRVAALFGVPAALITGEGTYNNSSVLIQEFYKNKISPLVKNLEQKLTAALLKGYPNLCVKFDTREFLAGDQTSMMNLAVAGVKNGIWTPNEARRFMALPDYDGDEKEEANKLKFNGTDLGKPDEPAIPGSSDRDTGGGGNLKVVPRAGRAGTA